MFNKEEKKLGEWKTTIENKEIPHEKVDEAIWQGFERAKRTKQVKRHPFVNRGAWSVIIAAILFITLVTSIRVSPVMANAVASIPGMERFVDFIRDDKGLAGAIENEYYQPLNIAIEKDHVTITLDGVLADEQEMIVFYTIKGSKKDEVFDVGLPEITDLSGKDIMRSGSATPGLPFYEKGSNQTGKVNIQFQEDVNEKEFIFKATAKSGERSIDFKIPFELNKVKMPTTRYLINKTALIEGQKIKIKQIDISPLKVAIHVSVDSSNTKKIFGFEDLRLVDEQGETWTSINNGTSASGDEDSDAIIYYLQSNYFEQPKELYLQFNKLMALEKEEAYLLIDTVKEKILQQPKDNKFSNLEVRGNYVALSLKGNKAYHHDPFSNIIDANGKEQNTKSGHLSKQSDEDVKVGFTFSNEDFVNPIQLPLEAYPSYIEGDIKIKIK